MRTLWFRVEPVDGKFELKGEFVVFTAYRIIVCAWLWAAIAFNLEQVLVPGVLYRAGFNRLSLLSLLIAPAMAYGYTALVLVLSRGREESLLRLLEVTARGSREAAAARHLLVGESPTA